MWVFIQQKRGLDVSCWDHYQRDYNSIWFRKCIVISEKRKVVDSPFIRYMATKPGIVVCEKTDQLNSRM